MKLKQVAMLAEAIPSALRGQRVIVFAFNYSHCQHLCQAARGAIANDFVQRVTDSTIRFNSGGVLRFISIASKGVDPELRGHSGPVYMMSTAAFGEDEWELCTTYIRDSAKDIKPQNVKYLTRLERVLLDDDD
jgi:hypothetical protein